MYNSRASNSHRTHLSRKVPDIPIHMFFKRIQEPDEEEFEEIYEVQTVLSFQSKEEEEFFKVARV